MPVADTGDTAFILFCTALVCLMTPGLAFFYGGLVRRKNVLTIMMQSFISMGVIAVIWIFGGFSLAFGPSVNGIIGDLRKKEFYESPAIRRRKKSEAARKRNIKG